MDLPPAFILSAGYVADRKAADEGRVVILHEWRDGFLLAMYFDDEMSDFTATPPTPADAKRLLRAKQSGQSSNSGPDLHATGYVFAVFEPSKKGTVVFGDQRYSQAEIYDYVLWTDDAEVEAKYNEVLTRTRSED